MKAVLQNNIVQGSEIQRMQQWMVNSDSLGCQSTATTESSAENRICGPRVIFMSGGLKDGWESSLVTRRHLGAKQTRSE